MQFIGKIIVADDQLMNLEVIKGYTERLEIFSKTEFCIDGQKAIDMAKNVLDCALVNLEHGKKIKPVFLMLIDFQMP